MKAFPEFDRLDLDSLYGYLEVALTAQRRVLASAKVLYRGRIKALENRIVELEAQETDQARKEGE